MKRVRSGLFALLLVCAAGAVLAQPGYMLRKADLKAKPFIDADTVVALPEKTPVQVVKQEGAWLLVKVRNQQGYVRFLYVRYNVNPTAVATASAGVRGFEGARPSAQGPSTGTVTATTGVRGFDEAALKAAQPDPEELKRMQGFAASAEQARQFAQRGQLSGRTVTYHTEDGKPIKGGK
jgi:hypothetical protein